MMWQYSRRETKLLLLATLMVFSAFGFLLAQEWQSVVARGDTATIAANSVGVFAAVPQNEINALAADLAAREQALIAREEAIREMERQDEDTRMLLIVSLVGAGLLGLILLNFYLDNRRRHSLA